MAKNGRLMLKCKCVECGITKTKFVKSQSGGALARYKGPSTTDKIAYMASNFVTPAPSFGAMARLLAGQAFKGVKDNVDYYRKGNGIDIHKAILKVAPKKGFVMPGHRYTGPGNPLEKQVKWDQKTGKILEIYEKPTGKTDAVSMQHDVDYSVCANKSSKDQVKCKNEADRKMVKSLDAIPWKDRQWGHALARNIIAGKSKILCAEVFDKTFHQGGPLVDKPQHHGAASRERKLTMTLLMVVVISLLLYIPDEIYHFLDYFTGIIGSMSKVTSARLHNALNVSFYANSLVNPILYAIRMSEYRSAVLALFRRRPQQQRQAAGIPLHDM
ncbi:hypothetical protein ACROYT_G017349 [Oculina patagonica]